MPFVDIFTKYTAVIPTKSKADGDVLAGLMEGFTKVGGYPESIYTDDEPSFSSKYAKQYFAQRKIKRIITRAHAAVAERDKSARLKICFIKG